MAELWNRIILIAGLMLYSQLVQAQISVDDELSRLKFSIEGLMAGQADNSKKMTSFRDFQSSAEAAGEANLDAIRVAQEATHTTQRSMIKAMYADTDDELKTLQLTQAENNVHAEMIQRKIDALAEQTSALTKQLTAYFMSKPSADNKTKLISDGKSL